MSLTKPPSMIFFDVLGTIVEWRFCIAQELKTTTQRILQDKSQELSPETLAYASNLPPQAWQKISEEWHTSYMTFGNNYDLTKPSKFIAVDEHNRISLEKILTKWSLIELFTNDELENLTLAWHRLDAYPDSVLGLSLLNTKFSTSTLSNGNIDLLEDLKRHNALPFKHLTSAEHLRAYKPSPEAYNGAARRFGLEISECCLVAAHLEDLHAAKRCGFQTVYLEREMEEDWDVEQVARAREEGFVDYWVEAEAAGLGVIGVARYFGIECGELE